MCSEDSALNFPNNMKLLRLALLISPSNSGVKSAYSIMNLLVSTLHKSLNKNNINQLMLIYLDEPWFLTEEQLEKIIDIYKDNAPCRVSLQCFLLQFFTDLFFDPCSMTYLVSWPIALIYIILDWNVCVLSLSVIECKSVVMK